jgi:DNA-binding GntR family transcriptional regulator
MAVLCLTEQPVSRRWIETHTGYGSRVIRDALHHLENAGLAARAAQGWTLSAAARHLISKRLTG